MIVITGARGFIASNLAEKLNNKGLNKLILVDEVENQAKNSNINHIHYEQIIDRNDFLPWFNLNSKNVDFVFHLGARTDTTEKNEKVFNELNLNFSKRVFETCTKYNIPLVYASSAATYGNGDKGYDDTKSIQDLKPLNPYGWSKQAFDLWVLEQKETPDFWVGLKFFNVYGKHENHKKRMASVVYHTYNQIKQTGEMKLFMSHKEGIAHGEQRRDFIAVDDLVDVCYFFYSTQKNSGLYNLGTGEARTFNELAHAVFNAMQVPPKISYIPTPTDIREAYQYYTKAEINKLRSIGYTKPFTSLEDGVREYVQNFLQNPT